MLYPRVTMVMTQVQVSTICINGGRIMDNTLKSNIMLSGVTRETLTVEHYVRLEVICLYVPLQHLHLYEQTHCSIHLRIYQRSYIWTAEKGVKAWLIIAVIYTTQAVVKLKSYNSWPYNCDNQSYLYTLLHNYDVAISSSPTLFVFHFSTKKFKSRCFS